MCGFAGYYGAGDFNREEVIDQMGERIAHRGPDSKGSFVDDYVALGFRRLSIIDLEGGSQPIHSADGKHVIIFNGEIYNYQEIRKELIEKHGCQFQTNSDTEVILQGYKTYGEKIASMMATDQQGFSLEARVLTVKDGKVSISVGENGAVLYKSIRNLI